MVHLKLKTFDENVSNQPLGQPKNTNMNAIVSVHHGFGSASKKCRTLLCTVSQEVRQVRSDTGIGNESGQAADD